MQNTTKTATAVKKSNGIAKLFRRFLSPRKETPKNFNFVKEHQGTITFHNLGNGVYQCKFKSKKTGKTAFAFGKNFGRAYANMIEKFNLKYSA